MMGLHLVKLKSNFCKVTAFSHVQLKTDCHMTKRWQTILAEVSTDEFERRQLFKRCNVQQCHSTGLSDRWSHSDQVLQGMYVSQTENRDLMGKNSKHVFRLFWSTVCHVKWWIQKIPNKNQSIPSVENVDAYYWPTLNVISCDTQVILHLMVHLQGSCLSHDIKHLV